MNTKPNLRPAAAFAGLAVIAWVAAGYGPANPLALGLTALMGAFYLMGLLELRRFQQATEVLAQAIDTAVETPSRLHDWLDHVPAALHNAVRRRIEGAPVALPAPALAPSLAGLLVLLGMLGTFVGMVLTLRGTGAALESATDLVAVRNSLVAPVKGLGLAFGTSVAGVAASAALGLVSALCRRERLQVTQRLDALAATTLRRFSQAHQRETSLELLQRQVDTLPAVVERLNALMGAIERQSEQTDARLLASQQDFHRQATAAYTGLAASVERTLQASLAQGARSAGVAVEAVATRTLEGLARETSALQASMADTFAQRSAALLDAVAAGFERQSTSLLQGVRQAQAEHQVAWASTEQERTAALARSLQEMAAGLQREWQQAGSEVARLVKAASEAPRAASELITELRRQLSDSLARDNGLLDERSRMLETVGSLLDGVNRAAHEQRGAIDALVASAATLLDRVGQRFGVQVEAQAAQLNAAAAQVGASAIELASLGEAFGFAVQLFSESNEKLGAQLQRIDSALSQSMSRSDDQLAYYVAQAREVIDLSLLSQKQIVEDLQRLTVRDEMVHP
jgi:hypothetical protein